MKEENMNEINYWCNALELIDKATRPKPETPEQKRIRELEAKVKRLEELMQMQVDVNMSVLEIIKDK